LKRALARMGAPNLVPDNMDNSLSYSVITYLKKLKNQAKIEMDRLIASVGQKVPLHEGIKVDSRTKTSVLQRRDFNQLLQNAGGNLQNLKQELNDYNTFTVAVADRDIKPQYYRNPYDIPRKSLIDQIARMRSNFLQKSYHRTKLVDDDQAHSIPVQQMGNYQDYLKKQPAPLRELETSPARLHTFGNPFKVKMNMVDEADDPTIDKPSKRRSLESPSPGPKKRKVGPLPKDYVFSRSPTPSPPASPIPDQMIEEDFSPKPEPTDYEVEENNVPEQEDEDQPLIIAEPEQSDSKKNHVGENHLPHGESEDYMFNSVNSRQKSVNNSKKDSLIWTHNTRLKHTVYKELKKPGRNYDNLFHQLNSVQGNVELKCAFISDVIREASRFKKKVLIQMLEQFQNSLMQVEGRKRNSFTMETR
ncbi:integrator complex subunit 6-like, partial [Saccostrea cucullata]|uniref:integrator complex subunit 6-like n=1 Tax=Saccostrea cuccullata TaxID=36930 RepID=UPI002ED2070B